MTVDLHRTTFYVDFDRIRKQGGYVYYWMLQNLSKRDEYGVRSVKTYNQGDCNQFRFKQLNFVYHSKQMGNGVGKPEDVIKKH